MTKLLSVFRPRVALRIQSCPDPLIDMAVLDSAIEFCERSTVLRRTLDPITTKANTHGYDIDTPACTKLVLIHLAWCDSRALGALAEEDVGLPNVFRKTIPNVPTVPSRPESFLFTEPGTIGLYPIPDAVYTVTVRASIKPTRDADCVEDELYDDWVEPIVAGALARLYFAPEFMNAQLAEVHQATFERGVRTALIQANRGRAVTEQRIQFPHI